MNALSFKRCGFTGVRKSARAKALMLTLTGAVLPISAAFVACSQRVPDQEDAKPKGFEATAPDAELAGEVKPVPDQYIVTLKRGEDPRSVAASAQVDPIYIYEDALTGFTAVLSDEQLNHLRNDKAVLAIEQDQSVTADEASRHREQEPP